MVNRASLLNQVQGSSHLLIPPKQNKTEFKKKKKRKNTLEYRDTGLSDAHQVQEPSKLLTLAVNFIRELCALSEAVRSKQAHSRQGERGVASGQISPSVPGL